MKCPLRAAMRLAISSGVPFRKTSCTSPCRPMRTSRIMAAIVLASCFMAATAAGGVGDPQLRTDHPWYPGELAC